MRGRNDAQRDNALREDAKAKKARGTHFLPHKPINVPGLCGVDAHIAIAIPMDHPSRGFEFPH